MIFIKTDFPVPDLPSTTTFSPLYTSRFTPLTMVLESRAVSLKVSSLRLKRPCRLMGASRVLETKDCGMERLYWAMSSWADQLKRMFFACILLYFSRGMISVRRELPCSASTRPSASILASVSSPGANNWVRSRVFFMSICKAKLSCRSDESETGKPSRAANSG